MFDLGRQTPKEARRRRRRDWSSSLREKQRREKQRTEQDKLSRGEMGAGWHAGLKTYKQHVFESQMEHETAELKKRLRDSGIPVKMYFKTKPSDNAETAASPLACGHGAAGEDFSEDVDATGRADLIDDPRLQTGEDRYEHKKVVNDAITEWTLQHTKEDVMEIIASAKVPCGAVFNTLELLNDSDLHDRGMMTKIDHPVRGEVTVSGWPVNMSDSHVPITTSPLHGGDNEAIYGDWLGISPEDVKAMRENGVI